jgi:hypothetical protein
MAAAIRGSGDLSATPSLRLNEQRDWRVRWRELQAVLERVRTPRADAMGLEGLDSAKSDLLQLFVKIWHFKDALKAENPGGVRPLVEPFANNSADLKLIADLCNVEKHVDTQSSGHSPRSGSTYPTVGAPTAHSDAQGGWTLHLPVMQRNMADRDGVDVAQAGIAAWRAALSLWRL